MPTPVPLQPQESSLDRLIVGAPASARHGARWASQIAHLLGRQTHRACSHAVQELSARTASTKRVVAHYLRSKGAQVALVAVELRDDNVAVSGAAFFAAGYQVNVTVTAPSGATWIDRGALDGSTAVTLPSVFLAGRKWLVGLMDVSSVSQTSVSTVIIDIVGVGGDTHLGLATVHVVEMPLASIKPESSESGLLLSWCDPRNWLEEGASAAGPRGLSALVDIEQQAAIRQRWWWQILGYEDSAPSTGGDTWYRTSAVMGVLNWRGSLGTAYSPKFRTRLRQIHSGTCDVTGRVRVYTSGGGTIRFVITPVGGGATNFDVVCPASAAWASVAAGATLSVSGSQLVDVEIQALATSGTIYLSNATLQSAETV